MDDTFMSPVEADLRRCEELWFEDGNIVLRAEHTIFRLYKGFLASHSSIFHDMLALPQPADGSGETYDNCEVVYMNDSAYEMTEFLKALYRHSFEDQIKADFSAFATILRLSNKYNVDQLRSRAIAIMMALFPTSLQEWQKRSAFAGRLPNFPARPIAILVLAEECDVRSVIPAALYGAATNDITFCFSEVTAPGRGGLRFHLSPPLQRAALIAKGNLPYAVRSMQLQFLSDLPLCTDKACRAAFTVELKRQWKTNKPVENYVFADYPWTRLHKACSGCLEVARRQHQEGQQAIWDKLPTLEGFDGWDDFSP